MWQQLSKFVAAAVAAATVAVLHSKIFSVHISLSLACLVFPFRGWAEQLCKYLLEKEKCQQIAGL